MLGVQKKYPTEIVKLAPLLTWRSLVKLDDQL